MAFAHAKKFSNRRKMQFLVEIIFDGKQDFIESIEKIKAGDKLGFNFTEKEWQGLTHELNELANYSFIAEKLSSKGISCIIVMDKYVYPATLKQNLKIDAPVIIYAKGNLDLIKKKSVAIVGARKSSGIALEFTDNVAKNVVKTGAVVVSGFAKGVDKMALDSTLKYKGKSIIVLPQGIDTYTSKTYYSHIVNGDVLVISTYHPNSKWSVGLAMDRNKTIYGLAEEIYAAESNSSGGTWEGVIKGLKRGREVFVRKPKDNEDNANNLLIKHGATPVNQLGEPIKDYNNTQELSFNIASDPQEDYSSDNNTITAIYNYLKTLKGKGASLAEIEENISLTSNEKKQLASLIGQSNLFVKQKKVGVLRFSLREEFPIQKSLF